LAGLQQTWADIEEAVQLDLTIEDASSALSKVEVDMGFLKDLKAFPAGRALVKSCADILSEMRKVTGILDEIATFVPTMCKFGEGYDALAGLAEFQDWWTRVLVPHMDKVLLTFPSHCFAQVGSVLVRLQVVLSRGQLFYGRGVRVWRKPRLSVNATG
jgi:hypothetical protein